MGTEAHLETAHGVKKDALVQLRSKYWVTKARNLVRHVLHGCSSPCKRLEGKAFKSVESPQLPSFRVRQSFPFANTGVDYFGPVFDRTCTEMHKMGGIVHLCCYTGSPFRFSSGFGCFSVY